MQQLYSFKVLDIAVIGGNSQYRFHFWYVVVLLIWHFTSSIFLLHFLWLFNIVSVFCLWNFSIFFYSHVCYFNTITILSFFFNSVLEICTLSECADICSSVWCHISGLFFFFFNEPNYYTFTIIIIYFQYVCIESKEI